MTGTACRAVQFDVPTHDFECLWQIKGFEDFGPACETLMVLKPVHGLKDAPPPRAWRTKLHQVLEGLQSCQQLCSEPGLYCVHTRNRRNVKDTIARAKAHALEQQQTGEPRPIILQQYEPGYLQCLQSFHIAPKHLADSLHVHLNASVGQCKADCSSFLHVGMRHGHASGPVLAHQYVYVGSITPIDAGLILGKEGGSLCGEELHEAYRSVLGTVAWTVLTRVELAVYVQALQRRADD